MTYLHVDDDYAMDEDDNDLSDFDEMVAIPDHFHCSVHALIDGVNTTNKVIDPNEKGYKEMYEGYAKGLQKTWKNSRMDLTAQDLFKFQSKFVCPFLSDVNTVHVT